MSKQYRPVFSASQILRVKDAFADSSAYEDMKIYAYLCKFTRDIELGYKVPAHTKETTSLEVRLGIQEPEKDSLSEVLQGLTKPEIREYLFNHWKEGKPLEKKHLEQVETYRYENDLMSSEEQEEYESKLFGM